MQPRGWQSHGSVASRPRPTGAWGRHPAEIFSICVQMARVSRPAQSVDSPGRLSVVRRIGRHSAIGPDIESLRSERTTNKTSHSSDAQQRRWSLFEFRDLSHKRPTTTSLLPSRTVIFADWHALDHPIRLRQLARPMETRRQSSQSRPGTQIPLEQAVTEVGPMHQNPDANHNE